MWPTDASLNCVKSSKLSLLLLCTVSNKAWEGEIGNKAMEILLSN